MSLYLDYEFIQESLGSPVGFPHSEIPGSKSASDSPGLIAGNRVLHRLPAPRHSPRALSSLSKCINLPLVIILLAPNKVAWHLFHAGLSKNDRPFQQEEAKFVFRFRRVVGQAGLEPATPRLSSACSNQLSYRPCLHRSGCVLVELRRFELLTSCLQSRRSTN